MKMSFLGLLAAALIASLGCGGDKKDPVQATRPAATPQTTTENDRVTTAKPEVKDAEKAEKTEPGKADNTFSLSVPFEALTLTQGEEIPVRVGINRGENFGEEVEIDVSGLPAGVTVETDDSVIAHGSMGVTLTFRASADAALGDFTAKVVGSTQSSSPDFSKEIELTVAPNAETVSDNE